MVETAALGVKVSQTGLDTTTQQLEKFVQVAGRAEKGADDVSRGTGKIRQPATQASESVRRLGGSFDSLVSSTKSGVTSLGSVHGSMMRLVGTAGLLLGAFTALVAGGRLSSMADQWSDMQSKVGSAMKDMAAAPEMMQRMVQLAKDSYSPLQQTVEVYSRNVAILRDLGKNATQAADYTEALNHALVTTATRGEDARIVLDNLSRSMSSGKMNAESFDVIMARSPRVIQAVADKMGVMTNEVRKLAQEGKVTADIIASAMIGSLEQLREEAGRMPATIGDAMGQLGVSMLQLVGTLDQALGASQGVASGIQAVSDAIGRLASGEFNYVFRAFYDVLVILAEILLIVAATRLPALIASLATTVAGIWAANAATVASTASLVLMNAQMLAGVVAARGFTGAVAAMAAGLRGLIALAGGPLGVLAGVATAIGYQFYKAGESTAAFKKSLEEVEDASWSTDAAMSEHARNRSAESAQAVVDALKLQEVMLTNAKALAEQALADQAFYTNFFGFSLYETEAMARLKAQVETLGTALEQVGVKIGEATAEQQRLAEATNTVTLGVVRLTSEQEKALATARTMLRDQERSLEMIRAVAEFGEKSNEVAALAFRHERELYLAKLDTLGVAGDIRQALIDTWMEEQRLLGKTIEWDIQVQQVRDSLNAALEAARNVAATEPGATWLDNAILKAQTFATALWDAWSAQVSIDSGAPTSLAPTSSNRPPPRPIDLGVPGGGSGKGGGGAKAIDEMAEAAKRWTDRIKAARPEAAKLNDEVQELDKLMKAGKLTTQEHAAAMDLLKKEWIDSHPYIGKIGDAIAEFVVGGMRNFKDLLAAFKDMIKQMLMTAIANPIKIAIGTALFGAGSMGGSVAQAATGAATQGLMGNILSGLGLGGGAAGAGGGLLGGLLGGFGTTAAGGFSLAGGTGLLGGLGNALSGGLAGIFKIGGAAAAAGGGIMATIGAAIPVIGIIAGIAALGKSLFGRKLKDVGLEGNFDASGFSGNNYQFYKGGLFSSNKTKRSAMDGELSSMINSTFGNLKVSIVDMAKTVGLGSEALDNFSHSFKFSTKGMSQEAAAERLQEELEKAGVKMADLLLGIHDENANKTDSLLDKFGVSFGKLFNIGRHVPDDVDQMAAETERELSSLSALFGGPSSVFRTLYKTMETEAEKNAKALEEQNRKAAEAAAKAAAEAHRKFVLSLMKEGETSLEFLTRISAALAVANPVMEKLRLSLFSATLAGGAAASAFVDLFGGLEGFTSAAQAYYDTFYTDAEKYADAQKLISDALKEVGVNAIPSTIQAYRALVDSMDAKGASDAVAVLMQLGPAFAQFLEMKAYMDSITDTTVSADVLREREALERQLLQLQGNTTELRRRELAALDASNRGLQQQIWALQDAQAVAAERLSLELRLLQVQGNTTELRRRELAELDASNRALQEQIWAQEEANQIAEERKALERQLLETQGNLNATRAAELAELDASNRALQQQIWAAQEAREVAEEREELERQLLEVQGKTNELRALDLAALDASNRALQQQIWEAERAAEVASERTELERRLLEAQGDTSALRALELAELDASNRALQEQIWAQEKANEVASQRESLERRLIEAQGDLAKLRQMELAALDATNRTLLEQIWAQERANEVATQRAGLERKLLEVQGDTAALRAQDLQALDASNRALQEQIWALEEVNARTAERQNLENRYLQQLGDTSVLRERELAALDATNRGLLQLIFNLADAQAEAEEARNALKASAQARQQEIDTMFAASASIRNLATTAVDSTFRLTEAQRLNAEAQIRSAVQTGRIWDDSLQKLAERAMEVDASQFTSKVDFLVATARAAATLSELADAQEQAATAEQSRLDELLKSYGLETAAVLTLAEAVTGLDRAISKLAAIEQASAAAFGVNTPAFASGGYHRGGFRLVGENGPELEATGSARYYGASTTRGLLGGGSDEELKQELREVKRELQAIRAFSQKTADSTSKSVKMAQQAMIDSQEV